MKNLFYNLYKYPRYWLVGLGIFIVLLFVLIARFIAWIFKYDISDNLAGVGFVLHELAKWSKPRG